MNNNPLITDWIMVGVTAIYVVATALILLANRKAAKAAKEQLEESKRQYNESQRLGMMPYLKVGSYGAKTSSVKMLVNLSEEKMPPKSEFCSVRIRNIGLGTATDVMASVNDDENEYEFPIMVFGNDEVAEVGLVFTYTSVQSLGDEIDFHFKYSDLLGNKYKQTIRFMLRVDRNNNNFAVVKKITTPPVLNQ